MNRFQLLTAMSLFICLKFSALLADATKPDEFVKKNIQDIIEIVVKAKGNSEAEVEARRQKIKDIFVSCFDLPRLAGMTLGGAEWKQLTLDQKKFFTEKYAEFVLSFYIGKIENYNNNKIEFGNVEVKSGGKRATVNTRVEFQGAMAKMNYSLTMLDQQWKIYDVEVEGVRLSTTYRSQFQSILRKQSFEGLIAEIDKLISKQLKT
jgi:phospholipid transport system substrate-binding protein